MARARPQEIFRFLKNPRKPAILAMSRPDAKKNITTLVKAFGENKMLRELANLVLIMVRRRSVAAPCPKPHPNSVMCYTIIAEVHEPGVLYGAPHMLFKEGKAGHACSAAWRLLWCAGAPAPCRVTASTATEENPDLTLPKQLQPSFSTAGPAAPALGSRA